MPLGIKAATSGIDADIHKKMLGSGTTTLVFSNNDLNDIMKIIKYLEEATILVIIFLNCAMF